MGNSKRKNNQGTEEASVQPEKKQKRSRKTSAKGASKILTALDELTPGLDNQREVTGDLGDEAGTKDSATAGRQRGAKNYSNDELELLISCVNESVGVPQGFKGIAALYNRIAMENGWATRGANPLSQRWEKLKTMKPGTGNPATDKLHQSALKVVQKLEDESGMKTMNDAATTLHWEQAYLNVVQANDDLAGTPSAPKTSSGSPSHEVGPIIDLTLSGDESSQASVTTGAVVKQEAMDDIVVPEKITRAKGNAKPAKDNSRGKNVVSKTYRHGDGKVVGKTTATEKVLGTLADHLSPETQDKRDTARMELLRESRHQDRHDRILEEREREVIKTIEELKRENNQLRERAVSAETKLAMFGGGYPTASVPPAPIPPTYPVSTHFPILPAFASDPGYYGVPHTTHNNSRPEDVAGPSQHYYQGGVGAEDDGVFEDK